MEFLRKLTNFICVHRLIVYFNYINSDALVVSGPLVVGDALIALIILQSIEMCLKKIFSNTKCYCREKISL